jgi:hypothetical protein
VYLDLKTSAQVLRENKDQACVMQCAVSAVRDALEKQGFHK